MPLLVDSHNDLAWNMLAFNRDYTRAVEETRQLEAGSAVQAFNEDTLIGWPEYQRGRVAVVFSTLYAPPMRWLHHEMERPFVYRTSDEANRLYREQLIAYHRLTDSQPDKFRLVGSRADLESVLAEWEGDAVEKRFVSGLEGASPTGFDTPEKHRPPFDKVSTGSTYQLRASLNPPLSATLPSVQQESNAQREGGHPVGLVPLMEGADGIRNPAELEEWFELGLRVIGLCWGATRYSGGWREPGPLTEEGRVLLEAMADYNFTLDLSHMDEPAMLEALEIYQGPIAATHGNCLALLPNFPNNRQFSDRVLNGIIERDGVVGVVPFNGYLKVGWEKGKSRREEVSLSVLVEHIDHICQLAGDSLHAGIGSDFDGGFGLQSVPPEIESIADLQKLGPLLAERGYTENDVANILGGNWLTRLRRYLPS